MKIAGELASLSMINKIITVSIALDETTYLPNKAGETYRKLIYEEWNTQKTFEISHNEVRYDLRGFMGDYSLQILQGATVVYGLEFKLEKHYRDFETYRKLKNIFN